MTHKLQIVDNLLMTNFVHSIAFVFFYQDLKIFAI